MPISHKGMSFFCYPSLYHVMKAPSNVLYLSMIIKPFCYNVIICNFINSLICLNYKSVGQFNFQQNIGHFTGSM